MISVIIPVYNVEAFLPACLDSILCQTCADLEIIIVDDGSTDASASICDAYAARDARIRVIHQPNQGLSAARNAGVEAASGEYISFVDSDDFILPDLLEYQLELARRHDADYVQCGYMRCGESDTIHQTAPAGGADNIRVFEEPRSKMEACIHLDGLYISAWGKLFSRELIRDIPFHVGKVYEDTSFTLQAVHAAKRIVASSHVGYVYRTRCGSITQTPSVTRNRDFLDAAIFIVSFCEKHHPSLLHSSHGHLISACNRITLNMVKYGQRDRELEQYLKQLYRRYFSLKTGKPLTRPSKLFGLLARCCYPAAKLAARFIIRFRIM